jgi:glucose-1-phosphate adenylyltransferase
MNGVQVERNCRIQRAVVDKNVVIKENSVIGYNLEEDARRFTVSDGGIVFIPKGTVVEAG